MKRTALCAERGYPSEVLASRLGERRALDRRRAYAAGAARSRLGGLVQCPQPRRGRREHTRLSLSLSLSLVSRLSLSRGKDASERTRAVSLPLVSFVATFPKRARFFFVFGGRSRVVFHTQVASRTCCSCAPSRVTFATPKIRHLPNRSASFAASSLARLRLLFWGRERVCLKSCTRGSFIRCSRVFRRKREPGFARAPPSRTFSEFRP